MSYKVWIIIAIALFAISGVVGWVKLGITTSIVSGQIAGLEELVHFLNSQPPLVIAIIIFAKNSVSLLVSFVLSPFLCIAPVIALTANGALLGWISATVIQDKSLGVLLGGLLPHGVIELPAFIIGEAAALSFGSLVMVSLFKKETRILLWPRLKQNLKYLTIALALLMPAALIEAFITPLFIK